MKCAECKGRGSIDLFLSSVRCDACGGSGEGIQREVTITYEDLTPPAQSVVRETYAGAEVPGSGGLIRISFDPAITDDDRVVITGFTYEPHMRPVFTYGMLHEVVAEEILKLPSKPIDLSEGRPVLEQVATATAIDAVAGLSASSSGADVTIEQCQRDPESRRCES